MTEKRIDKEIALGLMKNFGTPEHVIRHCMAVSDVARALGNLLNQHGLTLSTDLVYGAAMVHDIARIHDFHEEIGATLLCKHGYVAEAEIVRHHMGHEVALHINDITELDLVCLGDRMVKEDQFVGLDIRMKYILEKWKGNPNAEKIIRKKVENQKALIKEIELLTGCSLEEIMEKKDEQ